MKLTALSLALTVAASAAFATNPETPFRDNFNRLNERNWTVSTWEAPGQARNHSGTFARDNVEIVDGMLRLRLTQERDARGRYTSSGGEVVSNRTFGYGVYEFRMRASSTAEEAGELATVVPGSVSAAFLYERSVNTEIDIEFSAHSPRTTHLLSWKNANYRDNEHTEVDLPGNSPHNQFHNYKIVWQPGMITFYRDNVKIAQHKKVVPQYAGPFIFNHWGSNNQWWGGWATPDETRYVYIDWFRYQPFSN